jgi:integrase
VNTVQPIRDRDKIEDIKGWLKVKSERDYVLFCTGIYMPIRISDILALRVRDVKNKSTIYRKEIKTGKVISYDINPILKEIYSNYCKDKHDYEFLFPSRMVKNGPKSITRQQVTHIMDSIAAHFKLENFGCHSMRKTFGYHHYQQYKDIEILRKIFNHHDTGITSRYIGITQDMVNKAIRDFNY